MTVEYRVRMIHDDNPLDIEGACNQLAADGWRLVNASVAIHSGGNRPQVWLFVEREARAR